MGAEWFGRTANRGSNRVIRRLSRRAFVRRLAALAANSAIIFRAESGYAQAPASPRHIVAPIGDKDVQMFRQGLRDAGYAEGRDVAIEWRSANGDYARIPELAADLVQRKVDVIVVGLVGRNREALRRMMGAAMRDRLNTCPTIVAPGASAVPGSLP